MTPETLLSIFFLAASGWAVPTGMMRILPDSQPGLLMALVLSVPLLALGGALLFAAIYAEGVGLNGLDALLSAEALWHFWHQGLRAALIWGPVLALTGLSLAHGIERRRGARMASRDGD